MNPNNPLFEKSYGIRQFHESTNDALAWGEFQEWVKKTDREFSSEEDIEKTAHSKIWWTSFSREFLKRTRASYNARNGGQRLDSDERKDQESAIVQKYLEFSEKYANQRTQVGDFGTTLGLLNYLIVKISPRAKHDPKVPDKGGVTKSPQKRYINWLRLDGISENTEAPDLSTDMWLDVVLQTTDSAWSNGISWTEEKTGEEEDFFKFLRVMQDIIDEEDRASSFSNHLKTIFEAVMHYSRIAAQGDAKLTLEEACLELGLDDREDLQKARRMRERIRRKLATAISTLDPELYSQASPNLRKMIVRLGPRNPI
jgi:hypothetical protein